MGWSHISVYMVQLLTVVCLPVKTNLTGCSVMSFNYVCVIWVMVLPHSYTWMKPNNWTCWVSRCFIHHFDNNTITYYTLIIIINVKDICDVVFLIVIYCFGLPRNVLVAAGFQTCQTSSFSLEHAAPILNLPVLTYGPKQELVSYPGSCD